MTRRVITMRIALTFYAVIAALTILLGVQLYGALRGHVEDIRDRVNVYQEVGQ